MSNLLPLPSRAVLSLSGPDTDDFLQGLITQDVAAAAPAVLAALLTPQGKVLFDFFLIKTDEGYLIDVLAEAAPALEKRLKIYKLRAKVDIARRDDLCVKVMLGNEAEPASDGGMIGFADPRTAVLGARLIAPAAEYAEPPGESAYHAARIASGAPEFGADFASEEVFLMDVNYDALGGVDYKKGCFVGQEVTSRMKRKGEARKRTCLVRTDDGALKPQSQIKAGETTLGEVSSTAGSVALARIRLDRLDKADPTQIAIDGAPVRIEAPAYL